MDKVRDTTISFDEDKHKYYLNYDGVEQYEFTMSVTGFTQKMLFDAFDANSISLKCAKNDPQRQFCLLAEWDLSAKMGTAVHREIERYLNKYYLNKVIVGDNGGGNSKTAGADEFTMKLYDSDFKVQPRTINTYMKNSEWLNLVENSTIRLSFIYRCHELFNEFIKMYKMFLWNYELIATEYIIFDEKKNFSIPIAGTIDALYWYNKERREVIIVDWKTNKKIFSSFTSPIRNLSPFHKQSLQPVEKYFCQLHCYSRMLETNYNVKVAYAYIAHFSDNGSTTLVSAPDYKTCACNFVAEMKDLNALTVNGIAEQHWVL